MSLLADLTAFPAEGLRPGLALMPEDFAALKGAKVERETYDE